MTLLQLSLTSLLLLLFPMKAIAFEAEEEDIERMAEGEVQLIGIRNTHNRGNTHHLVGWIMIGVALLIIAGLVFYKWKNTDKEREVFARERTASLKRSRSVKGYSRIHNDSIRKNLISK